MSTVEEQYQRAVQQRRELRRLDSLANLPLPYECPTCGAQVFESSGDCLGFGHGNLNLEVADDEVD